MFVNNSVGNQLVPESFDWFMNALFELKFDFIEYGMNRNKLLRREFVCNQCGDEYHWVENMQFCPDCSLYYCHECIKFHECESNQD